MKFVVNTHYGKTAAGRVILEGIEQRLKSHGEYLVNNDWEQYEAYDVAIFMAPDSKVQVAKRKNPKLLCGIFDPKVTHRWQIAEVRAADFVVVSSIEQEQFFLQYNKNVFIYYMFPDMPTVEKEHIEKKKIIIGYHGNKQHLDAMKDVSWALSRLALRYDIEFHAVYNVRHLGKWRYNVPKNCSIKHLQWIEGKVPELLKDVDIGIMPSVLPVPWHAKYFTRPLLSLFFLFNPKGYNIKDYIVRFKPSNNPGRLYVFSQLSIPVITDFTPSGCQFVRDGESGFLAGTREGWERALERLIQHAALRNSFARESKRLIVAEYSPEITFSKFISFIKGLYADTHHESR